MAPSGVIALTAGVAGLETKSFTPRGETLRYVELQLERVRFETYTVYNETRRAWPAG